MFWARAIRCLTLFVPHSLYMACARSFFLRWSPFPVLLSFFFYRSTSRCRSSTSSRSFVMFMSSSAIATQAFASPILPLYSSMGREVILPIRNEPAPPAPGTFAYRRLRRFQFWRIWRELRIAILAQGVWQDHHLRSFCDAALARVQDSLLDADHFCVLLSRCVR